jgi:chemotaxis signal transduction protein
MESNRASSSAPEIADLVQQARVAREQARQIESIPEERKLLFVLRISGILIGVPAFFVQAVIAAETPFPLPLAPAHLLGLVPHSEGALAVVDLARFLEMGTTTVEAGASRIVVIRSGELEAGVLCEQALGVHSAGAEEIDRDCVVHAGQLANYTTFECQLACGRVASLDHTRLLQAMQLRA